MTPLDPALVEAVARVIVKANRHKKCQNPDEILTNPPGVKRWKRHQSEARAAIKAVRKWEAENA